MPLSVTAAVLLKQEQEQAWLMPASMELVVVLQSTSSNSRG